MFRIEHYLGKEAVQNLLVFRFANTFLEPIWNRHYIQSVQVTMAEAFGVQGRGRFYEEAGAIRDVVQNHLLQVVGFLAMEPPVATYADGIRDEQAKVFRSISPSTGGASCAASSAGMSPMAGVDPRSDVETFAAVRLQIDTWRWAGVPFFIRAGEGNADDGDGGDGRSRAAALAGARPRGRQLRALSAGPRRDDCDWRGRRRSLRKR